MNASVPVLALAAWSGTGKTTLLKQILPLLRDKGLRVGVVKHTHHDVDLDTPGKDSYEIRKAGAAQVMVAAPQRWMLVREWERAADPELFPVLEWMRRTDLDLILVEGFKGAALPKIELYRAALGRPPRYPEDRDVIAVATDGPLPVPTDLPVLDLGDAAAVAELILSWIGERPRGSPDARRGLVRYLGWLRRYGLNDSHGGSGSVREGNVFWVSPAGAGADTLEPDDLLMSPVWGPCPAAASLFGSLCQQVYRRRADAGALLFSRGPHTLAATLDGRDFLPADLEGRDRLGRVAVIDIPYEMYLGEAPSRVADALTTDPVAVVRGQGVYACAESLDLAYRWSCALEASARIALLARQAGTLRR